MSDTSKPRPSRKLRKVLLATCIGVGLALLLAELGIRYVLYHPSTVRGSFERHLRNPENFADGGSDDDFWKIQYLGLPADQAGPAENPDAITGWTGHYVKPGTYEQVDEGSIGERTPILLYGDSFCQCLTPAYDCFQSLLERSDLADRYCLLNYGVGGFGLDQIYLLIKHSIDRHAARNPIVIVSVLVEDDLDRSVLSFRCWPKPRLAVVNGELTEPERVDTDPREYLRSHPIELHSFLWRYLLYKRIPRLYKLQEALRGDHRHVGEKRLLNFTILKAIHQELESRHLRHVLLLFHIEPQALERTSASEWQEPLLDDAAQLIGMPILDTRPWFHAGAQLLDGDAAKFYGHGSPLHGHWNALGNKVAFEAMRHAVVGDVAAPDTTHLASWLERFAATPVDLALRSVHALGRTANAWAQGGAAWLRLDAGDANANGAGADGARTSDAHADSSTITSTPANALLSLRGGSILPTELRFDLAPGCSRFVARASAAAPDDLDARDSSSAGGDVELDVRVDGIRIWHRTLHRGEPEVEISVDLTARAELAVLASCAESSADCGWVRLSSARIE
jgi:hypothetical protein